MSSVENHDAGEEDEAVRGLIECKKTQYSAGDQIIVYCRSIDQTKHLAEVLGCTAFYREAGTDTEKEAILEKLTKQKERVFTSTNALGEGIDALSIRLVIHVGVVDSLDDYGQQSGRAGRNGKTASEATIIRKMFVGKDGKRTAERGWKTGPEIKGFLQGDVCRRVVMDWYMDECSEGRPERRAYEAGEQRRDVCRGRGTKRVRVVSEGGEEEEKVGRAEKRQGGSAIHESFLRAEVEQKEERKRQERER
ncbi:hypothetical protein LTR66_007344 [Elasticomyces elasticus]|nr:hypothetical protein LTR66_007344 [Elasticomyces elasticus]KAK5011805.1 hypothetical protein LTR28_001691 [Elasticomyces elasticus]